MVSFKVYKPADNTNKIDFGAPKEIDKPEYDDVGVSFKGYSKTPSGNKEYILNPQEPADINFRVDFVGAETGTNLNRNNINAKDFYCNKIILSGHSSFGLWTNTQQITISDGTIIRLRIAEPNSNLPYFFEYTFINPIKFSKGNTILLSFRARQAGDAFNVNFFGWEE